MSARVFKLLVQGIGFGILLTTAGQAAAISLEEAIKQAYGHVPALRAQQANVVDGAHAIATLA